MTDLPCPSCGSPLILIEQYHRLFCPRCVQYAPEGYGDHGARHCPTCGGILSFIPQYDRFYCHKCSAYAPDESPQPSTSPTPEPSPSVEPSAIPASAPPTEAVPAEASGPQPSGVAPTQSDTADKPPSPQPTSSEPKEEAPAVEPSPPIVALAASKPAAVRVKVYALKKSELAELCAAYRLDPSGTKDELQERLLEFLGDFEEKESAAGGEEAPANEPVPSVTVVPEPEKTEAVAGTSDVAGQATQSASVVQLEPPAHEAQEAVVPAATVTPAVPTPTAPTPAAVEKPQSAAAVAHPCPTCGRELTFIQQYNRYYCYPCQRYAPAAPSKNVCPSCGKSMRWIDQYQRWWCASCHKYGPVNLPRPAQAVAATPATGAGTTIATQAVPRRTLAAHVHRSPGSGLGLLGFGLALYVLVEFFTVLAPLANLDVGNPFTAEMAALTQFFAIVFVAVGAMVAILAMRDRT